MIPASRRRLPAPKFSVVAKLALAKKGTIGSAPLEHEQLETIALLLAYARAGVTQ